MCDIKAFSYVPYQDIHINKALTVWMVGSNPISSDKNECVILDNVKSSVPIELKDFFAHLLQSDIQRVDSYRSPNLKFDTHYF